MSDRGNTPSQTRSAVRTRPQRPASTPGAGSGGAGRAAPAVTSRAATSAAPLTRLPIEGHRLIAAFALVLLLILAVATPMQGQAPNPGALVTPSIGGAGSVSPSTDAAEIARSVFRYRSIVERSQGNLATWPELEEVAYLAPGSERLRLAIIGHLYAESTGNINKLQKDTGLRIDADEQLISTIEEVYQGLTGSADRQGRGLNGQSAMLLLRSVSATGIERAEMEREALGGFLSAIDAEPDTWQFSYNWALGNFLAGNYAASYDAMRGISSRADQDGNKSTGFWMGMALLRLGEPGKAALEFNKVINQEIPEGGNEAFRELYNQAKSLSRQGIGAVQWANFDPAAAYDTYYEILLRGEGDAPGLYNEWLRLGMEQRAYERLLNDMASLSSATRLGDGPRLHHDRARLLTFLGRKGEAEAEYREALRLGENDASLRVSYGQALEAWGDHNGALGQAEEAIRGLGSDPTSADLSSVASAAVTSTTTFGAGYDAQQLLDANLLRARTWAAMGNSSNVESLVSGITQQADSHPAHEAGLLHLYAGFAAEAAGLTERAQESYGVAWVRLKALPAGSTGRAAALAGHARTSGNPEEGVAALQANGYDPVSPPATSATDPDAPELLHQGALLLLRGGKQTEAANALRIASLARNRQDVRQVTGIGRPVWNANGSVVPANWVLAAADAERQATGPDRGLTAMRYKDAFLLDPALAPAWNNLGVMYAGDGDTANALFYLRSAGLVSPGYAWGQHNRAALAYKEGIGNFFNAEAAQGAAIKAGGPGSLFWGYNLRADDRGPLPAPSAPPADLLSRLPAVLVLLLLLAHTLVGSDRMTSKMGIVPTKGILGRIASPVDGAVKKSAPGVVRPEGTLQGLLKALAIPVAIGTLGLAWVAGRGSFEVALVYLPVALLVAALVFGASELAQYLAARRVGGSTVHHVWPFGALLGVITIPFNFVYGWQMVTRVQPAGGVVPAGEETAPRKSVVGRRARTGEDLDLLYEAQAEAAADDAVSTEYRVPSIEYQVRPTRSGLLGALTPAARIMLAGLVASLALALLFGVGYWLTGWPSLRLGMFASLLVLVFTAVSEPPADGWTLYRRNAPLWLGLFVFAATLVTLLAGGMI